MRQIPTQAQRMGLPGPRGRCQDFRIARKPTVETVGVLWRARGTWDFMRRFPPLKRWAFLCCARGAGAYEPVNAHTFERRECVGLPATYEVVV